MMRTFREAAMTQPAPEPTAGAPNDPAAAPTGRGPNALVWRWWNLLLLLPLLMLVTAWFNKDQPRLFGMPFFYWYQLAFVFVGVACVSIVYAATKTPSSGELPPPVAAGPDDPAASGDEVLL
jgi:hypothetical protein